MSEIVERIIEDLRRLPPEERKQVRDAADEMLRAEATPNLSPQALQALVDRGLLASAEPRPVPGRSREPFQRVRVKGKPLSETILEDRR